MKRIYYLFLLFLGFICASATAQNLLYQKIEQEKRNGESFKRVEGLFTKAENNNEILREFRNPEEVSFMEYNSEVVNELPRTISLEILLNNKTEIIELVAVDNEFYSYTVTTETGKAFPANRAIKHYRGVIKDDESSIVALSFSNESANGIIANHNGNFNISSINNTNAVVFFKDDNTIYENLFMCGVPDNDFDPEELETMMETTSDEPLSLDNFKCLRIYFELRYDMYERFEQINTTDVNTTIISKTVGYFSAVFNQVSTLFFNAGINAYISELKINTQPDIYPVYEGELRPDGCRGLSNAESLNLHSQFGANLSSNYNGDIAQLVSVKRGTSYGNGRLMQGYPYQNYSLCTIPKQLLYSYVNIGGESCSNNNNHFSNYSWNINVIIHELGHDLGSRHTHACVWNGNNTALDGCYTPEGGCSQPGFPNSGTHMSYCHLVSGVGINFTNGFGDEPRDRIRSKICNDYACASGYCFVNIHIGYADDKSSTNDYTVPNGHTDNRRISNNIYAYHTVRNGGQANYTAGNSIRLLPNTVQYYDFFEQKYLYSTGFHAEEGSAVHLQIFACEPMEYATYGSNQASSYEQEENNTVLNKEFFVNLYPNPTPDVITIESNEDIIAWEIADNTGKALQSEKISNLKKFETDFAYLSTGVYFIRIYLANGQFVYKKMIKQ